MSTLTTTQLEEYKHLENQGDHGNLGMEKERMTRTRKEEKTTGNEEKENTTNNRTSHGKAKAENTVETLLPKGQKKRKRQLWLSELHTTQR
eukprot:3080773-Amphidinium_carterae.1